MKSKESVEYSYKCKGSSFPISLNIMSTWSYLSGRKKDIRHCTQSTKGIHRVLGNGSAIAAQGKLF